MKTHKHYLILIGLLLFIIYNCKKPTKNMVYKRNIVEISDVYIPTPSLIEKTSPLPECLYLNLLQENKVKIESLKLHENNNADSYLYGKVQVANSTIFIYSNEFDFNQESQLYGMTKGYALISNGEYITHIIKIYDYTIFSGDILYSCIYDNYILTIKSQDESFDVNFEGKKKKITYYFALSQIKENGEIEVLQKDKAIHIAEKYLFKTINSQNSTFSQFFRESIKKTK